MLARLMRELGGNNQCRDASGERRWRKAAEVLPAIEHRHRTFANQELCGRTHQGRVGIVVEASCYAKTPREQDRKRDLVELGRGPVRCAVEKPVLIPTAIGSLVDLEVT